MQHVKYLLLLFIAFTGKTFTAQAQRPDTLLSNTSLDTSLHTYKPLRFSYQQLIVPGALMIGGGVSNIIYTHHFKYKIVEERNEHFHDFHTPIDNITEFLPIGIAYGLDAFGVKSKTDFLNRSAIFIKGELLMLASVNILKYTVHEQRPDGTQFNSFPSGHTAQAFAAATFLSEEYRERYPWMPYVSYGIASATGIMRMANNRHYIGDVLFGAGLGILSMKVAYWTHQYKWGKPKVHSKDPGKY